MSPSPRIHYFGESDMHSLAFLKSPSNINSNYIWLNKIIQDRISWCMLFANDILSIDDNERSRLRAWTMQSTLDGGKRLG